MWPQIVADAYRNLLARDKIGTGADQLAAGDHVDGSPIIYKTKLGDTPIQNDSSYNIDPHIQGIALAVGFYHWRSILFVTTTLAERFKFIWVFSGTFGALVDGLLQVYDNADALIRNSNDRPFLGANILYGADVTDPKPIIHDGIIEITAAGALQLQWAQLTSGAGVTTVYANSFVKLTPLP